MDIKLTQEAEDAMVEQARAEGQDYDTLKRIVIRGMFALYEKEIGASLRDVQDALLAWNATKYGQDVQAHRDARALTERVLAGPIFVDRCSKCGSPHPRNLGAKG